MSDNPLYGRQGHMDGGPKPQVPFRVIRPENLPNAAQLAESMERLRKEMKEFNRRHPRPPAPPKL